MHDKSDSIMRLMAVQLEKVRAHPPTWVIDNRDSVCKEVNIQAFAHLVILMTITIKSCIS